MSSFTVPLVPLSTSLDDTTPPPPTNQESETTTERSSKSDNPTMPPPSLPPSKSAPPPSPESRPYCDTLPPKPSSMLKNPKLSTRKPAVNPRSKVGLKKGEAHVVVA